MRLAASDSGLREASFCEGGLSAPTGSVLEAAARQLAEYFDGRRTEFQLPLDLNGTAHDRAHWEWLLRLPYGATATYARAAREVGSPGGARAVGQANSRNPVAVIVPCHRVVLSSGKPGGYAGGLWRKLRLLELESGQVRLAV
jgi:methylated-DNA-[protein]-cysteine S-methyltransferase